MKYILTIALALVLCASCAEKTKEDYIKESFYEYVKTDFDDPRNFIEITKAEVADTFNTDDAKAIIASLANIQDFLAPQEIIKLAEYAEKFDKDKTCIISYRLNVRVWRGKNKTMVNYYIIDDGTSMKVQDHELAKSEVPELYMDFFEFVEDVINMRKF